MVEHHDIKNPKDDSINFVIYDTPRWNDKIELLFKIYMRYLDGAILLFNISYENDIDELPFCLKIIEDYFELEEFPILLIGTCADSLKDVNLEKFSELMKKYKFIKYFEVSSTRFKNVNESVQFMFDYICEKYQLGKTLPKSKTGQNNDKKK